MLKQDLKQLQEEIAHFEISDIYELGYLVHNLKGMLNDAQDETLKQWRKILNTNNIVECQKLINEIINWKIEAN